jgi:hypothetical protein
MKMKILKKIVCNNCGGKLIEKPYDKPGIAWGVELLCGIIARDYSKSTTKI